MAKHKAAKIFLIIECIVFILYFLIVMRLLLCKPTANWAGIQIVCHLINIGFSLAKKVQWLGVIDQQRCNKPPPIIYCYYYSYKNPSDYPNKAAC